jgi:hypothetical protein
MERAFRKPASFSILSVSGEIGECVQLTKPKCIERFFESIKGFSIPPEIQQMMKRVGLGGVGVTNTLDKFISELMSVIWRVSPAGADYPANCQIFGQIAEEAGAEAIEYNSVHTGRPCLAVFPRNFANSDSYVELMDDGPTEFSGMIRRLDRHTWQDLV